MSPRILIVVLIALYALWFFWSAGRPIALWLRYAAMAVLFIGFGVLWQLFRGEQRARRREREGDKYGPDSF